MSIKVLSIETLPSYSSIKREMLHFKAFLDMSLKSPQSRTPPPPPPGSPYRAPTYRDVSRPEHSVTHPSEYPLKDLSPSRFLSQSSHREMHHFQSLLIPASQSHLYRSPPPPLQTDMQRGACFQSLLLCTSHSP
jgi:hypothetical protein